MKHPERHRSRKGDQGPASQKALLGKGTRGQHHKKLSVLLGCPYAKDFNDCFLSFSVNQNRMLISCPWIFFRKLYGSSLSIPCRGTNQKAGREKVGNFWNIQTTSSSYPLIPCTQGTDQKAWGIRLNLTDDIKHHPK